MKTRTTCLVGCAFAAALQCHAAPVTGWVSIFDPQANTPRFTVGTEATDSPVTTDADQDSIAANFPSVTLADEEFIILTGTVSINVNLIGGQFRVGLFDGPAVLEDVGNPYLGFYSEGPAGGATNLKWGPGTNGSHAFGTGSTVVTGFLPGGGSVPTANTPIDFSLTITRDGANLDIESSYTTASGYNRSGSAQDVDVLAIKADYNYTFNTAAFLFGGSLNGSQATFSNIDVSTGSLDSDSDGMLDTWELANGLNVGVDDSGIDEEPDGLTNIQEYQGKDGTPFTGDETDPQVADSDDDGLTDGDEVLTHMTDPLSKDTDGDFFEDAYEITNLTDPLLSTSYPVPPNGLFVDFSNAGGDTGQDGPRHDVDYAPFGANHEIDSSNVGTGQLIVDRAEAFPVPAFTGSPMVTLTVAYPDTTDPRVKQMIGRTDLLGNGGWATTYEGEHRDLMRDWIGVDPRAANGGNGMGVDTTMTFTLSGIPAGIYQYRGYHHEVANIQGPFDLSVMTDGATNNPIGTFRMTHGNDNGLSPFSNPGTGNQPSELPSTIEFLFTSDGINDVVITYAAQERTAFQNSLVGVNAIEVTTAIDTDGDGIPDSADQRPNDDDTGLSSDADLLTDLEEFHLGTDLDNADTDGDGLNDDVETNTGFWTSASDTGTSPWVADWDGDGLLDGIETNDLDFSNWPTASGTDPFVTDTDLDGTDDGEEANGGFDPTDDTSFPLPPPFLARVIAVDLVAETITLEWDSVVGATYDVHGSNDLLGDPQATWFVDVFNLPSGGTTTQTTINLPDPVPTARFYKVFEFGP